MHIGSADIKIRPHLTDPGFLAGAVVGGAAAWRFGIGESLAIIAGPGPAKPMGMLLMAGAAGIVGQNLTQIAGNDHSPVKLGLTVAGGAAAAGLGAALLGGINGFAASRLIGRDGSVSVFEGAEHALKYARAGVGIGAAVGVGVVAEELVSGLFHRK